MITLVFLLGIIIGSLITFIARIAYESKKRKSHYIESGPIWVNKTDKFETDVRYYEDDETPPELSNNTESSITR